MLLVFFYKMAFSCPLQTWKKTATNLWGTSYIDMWSAALLFFSGLNKMYNQQMILLADNLTHFCLLAEGVFAYDTSTTNEVWTWPALFESQ